MNTYIRSSITNTDLDFYSELDVCATSCAVMCMSSIVLGFISGGYGLFSNYTCLKAYKVASCLTLLAGL